MVGADRFLHGLGEISPEMPAVCDLLGLRGSGTSALGVGVGPVPADDLHLRVAAQPRGQRLGVPAGKYVERLAGLQVDQEGGVGIAA